jgi:hypothetical protein
VERMCFIRAVWRGFVMDMFNTATERAQWAWIIH